MFEQATGWLGWSPDVAKNATAAEIQAALDGKVSFIRASNGQQPWPDAQTKKPDVASKMRRWLKLKTMEFEQRGD